MVASLTHNRMALRPVGSAWAKQGKDGKKFLSVELTNPFGDDVSLLVFPLEDRPSDNSPHYRVYKPSDKKPAEQEKGDFLSQEEPEEAAAAV